MSHILQFLFLTMKVMWLIDKKEVTFNTAENINPLLAPGTQKL